MLDTSEIVLVLVVSVLVLSFGQLPRFAEAIGRLKRGTSPDAGPAKDETPREPS